MNAKLFSQIYIKVASSLELDWFEDTVSVNVIPDITMPFAIIAFELETELDHDILDALGEQEGLPVPAGQADEQKADMDCAYQPRLLSAEGQHQQLVFTPDKGCSLVLFKLEVRFL